MSATKIESLEICLRGWLKSIPNSEKEKQMRHFQIMQIIKELRELR